MNRNNETAQMKMTRGDQIELKANSATFEAENASVESTAAAAAAGTTTTATTEPVTLGQQLDTSAKTPWAHTPELDFMFAARTIKDAVVLRNVTFKKTSFNLNIYERYLSPLNVWLLHFIFVIHLLLPLIEEPSPILDAPFWLPCCIEFLCLIIYFLRWIQVRSFHVKEAFNADKKNFVLIITLLLILVDLGVFMVCKLSGASFAHRFTRALRVLIYINFNEGKELRRAFRNVVKTLPDILNVFALFFFSMLIFGFVAWQLFKHTTFVYANSEPYFRHYEDSVWDLYVSVTTANFPDVMMPAYNANGGYAVFFIVFMLINLYIFINIILATIYTNYKKHLKEEVRSTIILKRDKVKDAFELLKCPLYRAGILSESDLAAFKPNEYIRSIHEPIITQKAFKQLMALIAPERSEQKIDILFRVLDWDNNGLLAFGEFVHLADLLNIRLAEIKEVPNLFENTWPRVYNSRFSTIIKRIVRHRIFEYFFDLVILLNILLVILDDRSPVEWLFLCAFFVEIALKVYTLGFRQFASDYWNLFDSFVILSGIVVGIIDLVQGNVEGVEILLILRSLRLLKFLASVKRFRTIISTIGMIIPSLATYAMLLLTIFYVFSMIGLEIFGKTIRAQNVPITSNTTTAAYDCLNAKLKNTDFARLQYCKNNFDSFPNSMVLLFELMVVNQWHVLSRGFENALATKWTRLYFLAFHISCVIVCLNIFTAFVIEAFLLEYESEYTKTSATRLEARIRELDLDFDETRAVDEAAVNFWEVRLFLDSLKAILDKKDDTLMCASGNAQAAAVTELKFHLNAKAAKPVEILLQRMFSNEFNIADEDLKNN